MKGKLSMVARRNSTMETLSAFADERQDITTAVSTPTKTSRRLATASMIFEKLNSPRRVIQKQRTTISAKRSSPSSREIKVEGVMLDNPSHKTAEEVKTLTISIARQLSPSGTLGIGLLLCTNYHGFQIVGIQGESASKNLVVSTPMNSKSAMHVDPVATHGTLNSPSPVTSCSSTP
jgi:hypothetical protein